MDPLFADPRRGDVLLANVGWCRVQALADVAAGESPEAVIDRYFGFVIGFVSERVAMVVPPALIPPEELAWAIERGRQLAEQHGW
jgi:uncharacterized membrane protein YedE/YeeE